MKEVKKRHDLLSKMGARGPWGRAEGEGRGRKRSREKCLARGNQ